MQRSGKNMTVVEFVNFLWFLAEQPHVGSHITASLSTAQTVTAFFCAKNSCDVFCCDDMTFDVFVFSAWSSACSRVAWSAYSAMELSAAARTASAFRWALRIESFDRFGFISVVKQKPEIATSSAAALDARQGPGERFFRPRALSAQRFRLLRWLGRRVKPRRQTQTVCLWHCIVFVYCVGPV